MSLVVGAEAWPELSRDLAWEHHHGVPVRTYRERPGSVTALLAQARASAPHQEALIEGDERLSYEELWQRVERVAAHLYHDVGVRRGDRVALLVHNGIAFCVAALAVTRLGAIAVTLNTKCKTSELAFMVSHAEASTLIVHERWWPQLVGVADRLPVRQYVFVGTPQREQAWTWGDLLVPPEQAAPEAAIREHDPAFILYTSGTTGLPKGALLSHWNIVHATLTYERTLGLKAGERTVVAVPLFHVTGLIAQFLTMVRVVGTTVVLPFFDAAQLLQILERERITFLHAAPTVYIMLLAQGNRPLLPAFRIAAAGGAAMPEEVIHQLQEWLPQLSFHAVYGLTETSSPATVAPVGTALRKPSSCGRPVPIADCLVVDADGNPLPPGQAGELLVRGATVFEGYWANPEATARTLQEGWLRTGDVALIDSEGDIFILDRVKDMINRGGEKIFSLEVENLLHSHPDILEAAVVGVPDPVYGEVPRAVVALRPGAQLSAQAVREFVAARLAKFKAPQDVQFVAALPRNPNGKVMKTSLRQAVAQESAAAQAEG